MNLNQRQFPETEECLCIIDTPKEMNTLPRLSSSIDTQWTKLSPEKVLVATANSAWLYKSDPLKDIERFSRSMDGTGESTSSTQNLLDGAIAAAYRHYSQRTMPDLTLGLWIWQLAGHYHLTNVTPLLIEESAEAFALSNRPDLAKWARRKAAQERRSNLTTVQDIEYLGYDARAILDKFRPRQGENLIDYLIEEQRTDHLCCLGYSYTLERIATQVNRDYTQQVESLLPPNISSPYRPWLYGSVGMDMGDVQDTIDIVGSLTGKERTSIAKVCYDVATICFERAEAVQICNAEIEPMLKSL